MKKEEILKYVLDKQERRKNSKEPISKYEFAIEMADGKTAIFSELTNLLHSIRDNPSLSGTFDGNHAWLVDAFEHYTNCLSYLSNEKQELNSAVDNFYQTYIDMMDAANRLKEKDDFIKALILEVIYSGDTSEDENTISFSVLVDTAIVLEELIRGKEIDLSYLTDTNIRRTNG